jgi:hypothetical protein
MGFWFVDHYGADGDLGGGPRSFRGLGVIMTVRRTTRGAQQSLGWHIIQHPQHTGLVPETEMVQPGFVIPWSRSLPATLTISFKNSRLIVTLTAATNKTVIYEGDLIVDLSGSYVGVTAQSDMFTSRFDLTHIHLTLPHGSHAREGVTFGEDRPKSNYLPDTENALRNPAFSKTVLALLAQLKSVGRFTDSAIETIDILDVINELTLASNTVASYKELNDWVRVTLIPYTQKWHRRTAKIVDNIRDARNVMGAAWNYTQEMMWALNSSVLANSRKAAFKLQDLGGLFESEAGKLAQEAERLGETRAASTGTQAFVVLSLAELVFVVFFFFVMQKQACRVAIFGR